MSARESILGAIRGGIGAERSSGIRSRAVADRLTRTDGTGAVIPARGRLPLPDRIALFITMAEDAAATVERAAAWAEIPAVVSRFLADHDLGTRICVAPDLEHLPWPAAAVEPRFDRPEAADTVGIARALAGVAETGTLALISAPGSPTSLNFLVDTHIVVLDAADIVGAYEEVWQRLRTGGALPRTVNLITGPSRTGDIEQTIQLGAHGPRRLHVVLVGNE